MRTRMLGLSRHSFYATEDGVGAGGGKPRLPDSARVLYEALSNDSSTIWGTWMGTK